jgi:hypothetical protein
MSEVDFARPAKGLNLQPSAPKSQLTFVCLVLMVTYIPVFPADQALLPFRDEFTGRGGDRIRIV